MEPPKESFIKSLKKLLSSLLRKKAHDPLEVLPKEVVDKIFSYCRGTDLLNCSLVNRKWYRFIAKSPSCMQKLKISIVEPKFGTYNFFTMEDSFNLIQNGRRYVHLSLACIDRQLLTQHKLLMAFFRLKSITLYAHTFKTIVDFINFLGIVEPHIEEITLKCIKYGRCIYEISPSNFHFPKLKRLVILNCYTNIYSEAFKNVKTLTSFGVATEAFPGYKDCSLELIERVKAIQQLLIANIDIKHLELFLYQADFDNMFIDQRFLRRIPFLLERLYVGKFKYYISGDVNIVQVSNFIGFLKSQESTLRLFYMEHWLGNEVLEYAVNDMLLEDFTISNLSISKYDDESVANLSLFSNDTIKRLSIWSSSSKCSAMIAEVLKVCRSLKVLEIRTINQEILDVIAEYNEDLEYISTDFFTAYIPPERAVLRNLQMMFINITCAENFRDLIACKNNFTNFEAIFLEAAFRLKHKWTNYNRY